MKNCRSSFVTLALFAVIVGVSTSPAQAADCNTTSLTWPFSRLYQAVYWDGRAWQWLPVNSQYPHVIMNERVNCDA